jgi:hypothetical protein
MPATGRHRSLVFIAEFNLKLPVKRPPMTRTVYSWLKTKCSSCWPGTRSAPGPGPGASEHLTGRLAVPSGFADATSIQVWPSRSRPGITVIMSR